jgi:hypothetical protein
MCYKVGLWAAAGDGGRPRFPAPSLTSGARAARPGLLPHGAGAGRTL